MPPITRAPSLWARPLTSPHYAGALSERDEEPVQIIERLNATYNCSSVFKVSELAGTSPAMISLDSVAFGLALGGLHVAVDGFEHAVGKAGGDQSENASALAMSVLSSRFMRSRSQT